MLSSIGNPYVLKNSIDKKISIINHYYPLAI